MAGQGVARHVERHVVWQFHWQLIIWHSLHAAVFAVYDWDRATPIALARQAPVAQPVHRATFTRFQGFHLGRDLGLRRIDAHAVEEARVGDRARTVIRFARQMISCRVLISWDDDRRDLEAVFGGKFIDDDERFNLSQSHNNGISRTSNHRRIFFQRNLSSRRYSSKL